MECKLWVRTRAWMQDPTEFGAWTTTSSCRLSGGRLSCLVTRRSAHSPSTTTECWVHLRTSTCTLGEDPPPSRFYFSSVMLNVFHVNVYLVFDELQHYGTPACLRKARDPYSITASHWARGSLWKVTETRPFLVWEACSELRRVLSRVRHNPDDPKKTMNYDQSVKRFDAYFRKSPMSSCLVPWTARTRHNKFLHAFMRMQPSENTQSMGDNERFSNDNIQSERGTDLMPMQVCSVCEACEKGPSRRDLTNVERYQWGTKLG